MQIRDITLRVLEQGPGVRLKPGGRRLLGERLIKAGITSLEVSAHGWGVDPDQLRADIGHWRCLCADLEVKMGATQTVEMVSDAAALGATIVTHWVPALPELTPVYWPEAYRRAWEAGDWRDGSVPMSFQGSLDAAGRVVERSREAGVQVGIGINLLSLANEEWLWEFTEGIAGFEPDEVWLSDGASGLSPEAWEYVVRIIRRCVPGARVSVYTKNAFGLGTANLIASARAGAAVLEASVNGLSMASGQPDLAQVATSLEVLYGVATAVDLGALTGLSQLVAELTGREVDPMAPVVGRSVHNWGGAEFISQERKLDPLIHWSYSPALVGGEPGWDVTPLTGMWGMSDLAERLDLRVGRSDLGALRELILEESAARRRALTDDEVRKLADTITEAKTSGALGSDR